MSDQTIYLRIGSSETISLSDFVDALDNFRGILQDVDAAMSGHSNGNIVWDVVSLAKNSPPVIGLNPRIRKKSVSSTYGSSVEVEVVRNLVLLRSIPDRTEQMPDRALSRTERLARHIPKIGPMLVYSGGKLFEDCEINEQTRSNVRELTRARYTAYGSLIGGLESISVHKGNEFRIWDRDTSKPVRCSYGHDREEQVKSLLRQKVEVSGIIESNSAGIPIRVRVDDLEPYIRKSAPPLEQIAGLISGFTGGLSIREFLEDLRGD